MAGVVIRGGGTAAYCSAHLLRQAGVQVAVQITDRHRVPAVMLSDAAVALIQDVFEEPDLFFGAHKIRKRIVAWGKDAEPTVLEHSAVVVSEDKLVDSLGRRSPFEESGFRSSWAILSSRPLPSQAIEHRFGTRVATALKVTLKSGVDASACWIESLDDGWLFLVPNSANSGWLLSVGEPPESLLASSRLVRNQLMGFGASSGEFPAYPRIVSPLCGEGWLACGTAAMAFDPICGDGTAHAIREAILAAAVIRASEAGENRKRLFAHYEARLVAGFQRHLRLCLEFYRRGNGGDWWDTEAQLIEDGLHWCARKSGAKPEFHYRLNGFELQAAS